LPVAPKLLTIRQGSCRDVVAQATKQGFLFVFDRVTGEPIWLIEERPVRSPTCRASTPRPRSHSLQSPRRLPVLRAGHHPYLPADGRAIAERLRSYRNEGLFTPPLWFDRDAGP
jgi:quinoprotein glucose dehydrogenase